MEGVLLEHLMGNIPSPLLYSLRPDHSCYVLHIPDENNAQLRMLHCPISARIREYVLTELVGDTLDIT